MRKTGCMEPGSALKWCLGPMDRTKAVQGAISPEQKSIIYPLLKPVSSVAWFVQHDEA